jgi:putative Mg2+ transporter-C (MgtC) family protein
VLRDLIVWIVADRTLPGLPLAMLLGTLVGVEREWQRSAAASLRSCVLIALAAAAFADLVTARVEAASLGAGFGAIATGVGFLGAGAILREGANVRGLSTAATIWCVAAIGAMAGAGEQIAAIWLTFLVLMVNTLMRPVQRLIRRYRPDQLSPDVQSLEG